VPAAGTVWQSARGPIRSARIVDIVILLRIEQPGIWYVRYSKATIWLACGPFNAHYEEQSSRSKQVQPLQVCGLVAESHVLEESSEWRTFANSVSKAAVTNTRCNKLAATYAKLSEILTSDL